MSADARLEQAVFAQLREVAPPEARKLKIAPELRLQGDLGLDSLALASLLFGLEGALGLDLMSDPDMPDRMRQVRTVADLVAFAASLRK